MTCDMLNILLGNDYIQAILVMIAVFIGAAAFEKVFGD